MSCIKFGTKGEYDVLKLDPQVTATQITPPVKHNCLTDGHLYASSSGGLKFVGLNNGDCISCRKSKKEIDAETLQFAVKTTEAFNEHKKSASANRIKLLKQPVKVLVSDSYTLDMPFGVKHVASHFIHITELRHPLLDTVSLPKSLQAGDSIQLGLIPEDLRGDFIAPVDGTFGFQHGKGAQYLEMRQGQVVCTDHMGWLHAEFDDCPMADDNDELVDNCDVVIGGKETSAKAYDPSGMNWNPADHRHPPEAYGYSDSREGTNAYMNNHQLRTDNDRLREQLAQVRVRLQKSQDLVDEQARKLSYLESRCAAHAKTIAVMRQERGPGIQHKPSEPTQTCHMGDYYED